MIILQNLSGESNVRDPRKIIITEKDREKEREGEKEREREREREREERRGNGRSIRRVQINIARGFARKSRTLQICRSVIASWYVHDKRSDTYANSRRVRSYWAVKYDLSINNVDRRRLCQNGAIRRSQASEIRNYNWLLLYGNLKRDVGYCRNDIDKSENSGQSR